MMVNPYSLGTADRGEVKVRRLLWVSPGEIVGLVRLKEAFQSLGTCGVRRNVEAV
jgi:hypothetical protein